MAMMDNMDIGFLNSSGRGGSVVVVSQPQQQQQQQPTLQFPSSNSDARQRRKRLLQTAQQQQQQQQQQAELPPPATTPQMLSSFSIPAAQYTVVSGSQPAQHFELAPATDNNNNSTLLHQQPAQQFVAGNTTYTLHPATVQDQQQHLISTSTPTLTMQPTQYLVVRQHQTPVGAATLVAAPRHHYMAIKRANDWGVVTSAGGGMKAVVSSSSLGVAGVGNMFPVAVQSGTEAKPAQLQTTIYHPALISAASSVPTVTTGFGVAGGGNGVMTPATLIPPGDGGVTSASTAATTTDGLVESMNVEEVNAALVLMSLSSSPHSPAMFAAQRGQQQQAQQLHRQALAMNAAGVNRINSRNIVSSLPDRSDMSAYNLLSSSTPSDGINVPTTSPTVSITVTGGNGNSGASSAAWQQQNRGLPFSSQSSTSPQTNRFSHQHRRGGASQMSNNNNNNADPNAVMYFHDEGVDVASSVEGINNNIAEEDEDEDDDGDEEMPSASYSSQESSGRTSSYNQHDKQSGEFLEYDDEELPRKRRNSNVMQFQCTWPKCRHHERTKDAIKQHIKITHFQPSKLAAAAGGSDAAEQDQDDEEFYYYEYDPSKAAASSSSSSAPIRVPAGNGGGGDARYYQSSSHSPSSMHSSQFGDSGAMKTGGIRKGREVKKCRKVYGMENRELWCTQCKWKKSCTRFSQD